MSGIAQWVWDGSWGRVRRTLNNHYKNKEPSSIVVEVIVVMGGAMALKYAVSNMDELKTNVISYVFKGLKAIPGVQGQVDKEKQGMKRKIRESMAIRSQEKVLVIPKRGLSHDEILKRLKELRDREEHKWKDGKVSGVVYFGDEKHTELMNQAYSLFSLSNPLHPDVFPSVRKFEAEIIRMTADMMRGDENVCGAVTSGGTESILMAVKAYRDRAKKKNPEMIVPVTAHAAFDKAGQYFGVKVVHITLTSDWKADVRALERAINKNTIMIAGSAPEFAHGMIDPIPEMAAIAMRHNIPFHSDCCLGGYLLPWLRQMGIDKITPFDFGVPGVTSISVDTHKYGYANKGTSVVLFKNEDYRRPMFFVEANWPGGVYASPTMAGSRPGGLIACCWASLVAMGQEGYKEKSKAIWDTAMKIKEGIKRIPNIQLTGDSYTSVIAFQSKSLDIFKVSDAMNAKGWNLNNLQKPASVHLCVTYRQVGRADEFLKDLAEAAATIAANPQAFPDGNAPMYGMAASFPERTVVADIGVAYLEAILEA